MTALAERIEGNRLQAFYDRYAAAVDDDIDRWPDFFTADAEYRIVPRENYDQGLPLATMSCEGRGMLLDRVRAIREINIFMPRHRRHLITNVRVRDDVPEREGEVAAYSHFAVFESHVDSGSTLIAVGRSFDRIVDDNGELRFREKTCVFDGNLVAGSLVYPL